MKLDYLSPAQWESVLQLHNQTFGPHTDLVRRMGRGFLLCLNCKRRENLTPAKVADYFREGWPHCCEGTLQGGTMNYYASEQNFQKEMLRVRS